MTPARAQHQGVDVWIIQLPGHAPYTYTRLKRVFASDDSRHRVVTVDLKKLLACADRDTTDYVLSSVQYWPPGKSAGIRGFLDPGQDRIPDMPFITFRETRTRALLGIPGLSKIGVASFRNGQHRARYLQYAGATSLPVEVHETEADLLARYCGNDGE
ncbi:plasmid fertility inhibition factor family protein [Burkholderia stagnalis]